MSLPTAASSWPRPCPACGAPQWGRDAALAHLDGHLEAAARAFGLAANRERLTAPRRDEP